MADRTCSVDDCDRTHYGHGWCQLHYGRMRKTGTTSPPPRPRRRQPAPCKIDGCDRIANVPGSARGWCAAHYGRWQRWGDPLGEHRPVVGVAPCSIEGCTDLVRARGWCDLHLDRYYKHGTPTPRLRGQVVEGKRICPGCRRDLPLAEFGRNKCYCKPCGAERTRQHRLVKPPAKVQGTPAACRRCGETFLANKRRSTYCSRDCFQRHKNKANWKHDVNRRARMRAARVEVFDRLEIFERDGYTCQICSSPVDPSAPRHSYRVPSIDHIIPLARGGSHTRDNVQTACLGCNVRKGVRVA